MPAWMVTTLARKIKRQPRLDNCLTWALREWSEKDGYLVIRWARSNKHGWIRWPHFLWLDIDDHHQLRHFMPKNDDQSLHMLPAPWFEGKIQRGDSKDHLEN